MDTQRLLERFADQMRITARRWSASPHDADDACQRAAELLLTRRPAGAEEDVCRWLRTTVKREALAIRAHHARVVALGEAGAVPEDRPNPADTERLVDHLERLRAAARAMSTLKAHERRCLALRAEGYSYAEIQERTGFSHRKVDRCLTEGRAALRDRAA